MALPLFATHLRRLPSGGRLFLSEVEMVESYMRGDEEMVAYAPGCFVSRPAGERLGLIRRLSDDANPHPRDAHTDVAPHPNREMSDKDRKAIDLFRRLGNTPSEIASLTGWRVSEVRAALAVKH